MYAEIWDSYCNLGSSSLKGVFGKYFKCITACFNSLKLILVYILISDKSFVLYDLIKIKLKEYVCLNSRIGVGWISLVR